MRYAVIADIHANLTAFKAVLEDIELQGGIDALWCLGDIVGYGPEPHECIALLRSYNHVCIAGNHDRGATGKLSLNHFNADAATVLEWTASQLSAGDILFLNNLQETITEEEVVLVHGSPRNALLEYISSISTAIANFSFLDDAYCFCGHTHVPRVYQMDDRGEHTAARFSPDIKLFAGSHKLIVNPGSVGQPRDGDPRASYALFDSGTRILQLRKVPYNIRETQNAMIKNNLPIKLISRLDSGT